MTSFARSQPKELGGSAARDEAVEIRGTSFPLTVLRLRTTESERLRSDLAEKTSKAGADFFLDCPVVVDLQLVEKALAPEELSPLFDLLRELRFVPVGVCNGSTEQNDAMRSAGLGVFWTPGRPRFLKPTQGREAPVPRPAPAAAAPRETAPDPTPQARAPEPEPLPAAPAPPAAGEEHPEGDAAKPAPRPAKVLVQPVRSGQRVYARGTDLVVVGAVNAGAEVIADGNVHVYGALRGRALAGASGDAQARIFCQGLEAELVSVAGTYRLIEDLPEEIRGKPAQVYVSDETLVIAPL